MDNSTRSHQWDQYEISLKQEKRRFESCVDVHNLPGIFHYWSNHHIRPKLLPYGFNSPNSMFTKYLGELWEDREGGLRRFVSLGAGNCELEVEIALHLRDQEKTGFLIECFDLSSDMLERGRTAAVKAGVEDRFVFTQGDLNAWDPGAEYDAVFANQSLHHVTRLEHLFDQIRRSLRPGGIFVVSDIIGRNGHQRWPEALEIVREFWRLLPPSYRFNHQLGCYEGVYENQDCSSCGFEGIRSQDILPLLLDRFHFRLFIPFGNVIDPFIDRSFGPNFDAAAAWDRRFVDEVHLRDEREIASGHITPTHMLAVLEKDNHAAEVYPQNLSPRFCVRVVNGCPLKDGSANVDTGSCQWQFWPHDPTRELARACERLAQASAQVRHQTARALQLEKDLYERTVWAQSLDREFRERTEWALRLESELRERTAWALHLDKELQERTAWALRLDRELGEVTNWALRLQRDLEKQSDRLLRVEKELNEYLHNPFRFAFRFVAGAGNWLRRSWLELRSKVQSKQRSSAKQ
jgi:SAM-dependent methyltransferase